MTRLDVPSEEQLEREIASPGPATLLLDSRDVPLGGIRGITVHRSLPQRTLPTVGAWCFLDYFDDEGAPMRVLPHPHIGLQTVTWPVTGSIRHRDSVDSDVVIEPGQLNIMTSGRGVSHSEFSLPLDDGADAAGSAGLRGVQLWVALPRGEAAREPFFEQHADLPMWARDGIRAQVLVGGIENAISPATIFSPLIAAQIETDAGTDAAVPVDPSFEHAVLVLDGDAEIAGVRVDAGPLLYLGPGCSEIRVATPLPSRMLLIGGEPFGEDLVMWWNFVGRTHAEIVAARDDWEALSPRFGTVAGHAERIPAPPMPNVRLTPRTRRR